jgi:hypothetical protein
MSAECWRQPFQLSWAGTMATSYPNGTQAAKVTPARSTGLGALACASKRSNGLAQGIPGMCSPQTWYVCLQQGPGMPPLGGFKCAQGPLFKLLFKQLVDVC